MIWRSGFQSPEDLHFCVDGMTQKKSSVNLFEARMWIVVAKNKQEKNKIKKIQKLNERFALNFLRILLNLRRIIKQCRSKFVPRTQQKN